MISGLNDVLHWDELITISKEFSVLSIFSSKPSSSSSAFTATGSACCSTGRSSMLSLYTISGNRDLWNASGRITKSYRTQLINR